MSGLMLADKMATQSEKLAKSEIALEEALTKANTLEENVNSQQAPVVDDLLEQLMTITEKAEKLASKISN